MFGEGFTHGSPVSSYQSRRSQPASGITRSDTGILRSAATIRPNSPMVSPSRTGIVWGPVKDWRSGSISGPSTTLPVIGFGRSSTTRGIPARPAVEAPDGPPRRRVAPVRDVGGRVAADPVLGREDDLKSHPRRVGQEIDRPAPLRVHPRLVGDETDRVAREHREVLRGDDV